MPLSPSRSSSGKTPSQRKAAHAAPKLLPDVILPPAPYKAGKHSEPIIAIGSSTGGTDALRIVLSALPADTPGIVVVQHMPPIFTARFAQRLDSLCAMRVKEAADGDRVRHGEVLIAIGGSHLVVRADGSGYFVNVVAGPPVTRHCPSVDVLFRSVAQAVGMYATAVILTGMGDDGALGMSEIKQAGGYTIAQNEETCVVYGMPKEAVRRGAIDDILPLEAIAAAITKRFAAPQLLVRPRGVS